MPTERFEIVITSKGSRTVKRDFDAVAKSADRTGTAAKRTGRTIDTSMRRGGTAARQAGAAYRRTARDIDRVGQSGAVTAGRMRAMTRSMIVPAATNASLLTARRNVRGLLGAFSAFYAVRFIGETADSFTRMNNALRGFGIGADSVDRVRTSINAMANDARVDAEQATILFGRLRLATRDLGTTEKEVLVITGTINKALRLSGSSALEASQSIRQLSQAFNKGKLDGDEFRSVLENAPILTKLLSKELGISKRELRKWAEEGKISVRTLTAAILAGRSEIEEGFRALKGTLGDAFKVLNNKIREFIGTTPAFSSSMRIVIKLTQIVGDNLSTILGLLTAIAGVKVGKTLVAFAASLGGGAAAGLSALAAATSAAPAAAVAAAGVAGGAGALAQRGFPAALAGGGAIASFGLGTSVRSSAGPGIPGTSQAIKTATKETKELTTVVTSGLGNAFKSVGRFIVRIGSRLKGLLTPMNLIIAAVIAIGVSFGGGVLDGIVRGTTATNKWEAATQTLGLMWRITLRYIDTAVTATAAGLNGLLRGLGTIGAAVVAGIAAIGPVITSMIDDMLRKAMPALKKLAEVTDAIRAALGIVVYGPLGPLGGPLTMTMEIDALEAALPPPEEAGKSYGERWTESFIEVFNLLDTAGGLFSFLDSALGDTGVLFADKLQSLVSQEKLRAEYEKTFSQVESQAGRLKDLFQSEDGAGSFLKPADIETEIAKLDSLLKLYDNAQLKNGSFDKTELANIKNAQFTLGEIRNFLKDSADALEAFDAAVRSGTGSEGDVKIAIAALEKEIQKAADKLPPELRDAAVAGANEMITQARAILVAGALDIGAAVKSALLQGFGGAVGGLLDAALATTNPRDENDRGLPPGLKPEGVAEAIGDGGAEPIKIATDKARLYNDELQTINRNLQGVDASAGDAFKRAGNSAKNAANDIQQFFQSAFGSLEDALVSFVTTGKLDFKSLINSIIADLARMVIRMLIIKPLMGFFGGLFGFSGGGVVPGFANGGVVKGFATGGVISGFGGAKSDNQLIAASPGEMIINKRATDDNIGALQYINKTGMMPPSPNKQGGIVYAPVINVQSDSGGDGQATAQMIDAAIRRSWDELAIKAQRKGGVLG